MPNATLPMHSCIGNLESIYLRLSVTSRCNLRCRYCRSESDCEQQHPDAPLNNNQIVDLVHAVNEAVPVYKLRITGGEPLLHPGLLELISDLRKILPEAMLCLTTNGMLLKSMADKLRRSGVDRVNVSLDTLVPERFESLTRNRGLHRVLDGIRSASKAGFKDIRLNTVLMRSINSDILQDIVRFAADIGCEIRFIELMPFGEGAAMFDNEYISAKQALDILLKSFSYVRSELGSSTARRHVLRVGDTETTVGFIQSISDPFCGSCDRVRLDSFGNMYHCLRSKNGIHLATDLRAKGNEALQQRIRNMILHKTPETIWPERSMVNLGG